MPRIKPIPDDIKEIRSMIIKGQLFQLQNMISAGRRIRCEELETYAGYCLTEACKAGGHSILEVLLKSVHWEQEDKNKGLSIVLEEKRADLVELLLEHGADPKSADFAYVARIVDLRLIDRFLQGGCDPEAKNGFARALDSTKARPLLKFLRSNIEKIPCLKKTSFPCVM